MGARRLEICYGGTFDPVHCGHLDAAADVLAGSGCDRLRLIPCRLPTHRATPGASAEQRCRMLELAVAEHPGLSSRVIIDRSELDRDGPSYTVDTLALVRAELGADAALGWVLGSDAFAQLESWRRWPELLELAHLLVLERPGAALPDTGTLAALLNACRLHSPEALRLSPAGGIWRVGQRPREVSASTVRDVVAGGDDPSGLIPPSVWAYICDEGLYQT